MKRDILSLALLALALTTYAQANPPTSKLFGSDGVRDALKVHPKKTLCVDEELLDDDNYSTVADKGIFNDASHPDYAEYSGDPVFGDFRVQRLRNRKALVGEPCVINKIVTEVGLGCWALDMGNMLDDDLNNYAQFNKVVGAAVGEAPVVSVLDMRNYYAAHTEAGFCVVASSGNAVLTLDVIKVMTITFYRDGKLVDTQTIEEGQGGEGIALKLITIPGSEDACTMLTARSDEVFDEVCLNEGGGVGVNVGSLLKVKYAFVGSERNFDFTRSGVQKYGESIGRHISIDYAKGWNPVILGIPFPMTKKEVEKLINDDPDDYATITPVIGAAYLGGVKIMCKDDDDPHREVYPAGYNMAFKFTQGSGLELSLGKWARIILFDRDGNKVQEETVNANVLGLTVGSGGDGSASITSDVPFSGAEIRFHGILDVNAGATLMHVGSTTAKADTYHHCDIRPHASSGMCTNLHSLQLLSNEDVPVTWEIARNEDGTLKVPAGGENVQVSKSGMVTRLEAEGAYTFRAITLTGCCEDYTTIVYGGMGANAGFDSNGDVNLNGCGRPLVNGKREGSYIAIKKPSDTTGALISISNVQDLDNIVSENFNSYATYSGGLNLAANLMIAGIRRTDGQPIYNSQTEDPKRIGFVVEAATTGLDLSALEFLHIKCYYQGKETYDGMIDENNAISAGIAGSDKMLKVRYSIELPAKNKDGNFLKCDEFVLYTSGLLKLGGDKLRIYYAFIEPSEARCGDPLSCDAELLSHKTHTRLNGNACKIGSAASVAQVINDINCVLDGDPSTWMSITQPVNAGGMTLAFNLGRTVNVGNTLGIITEKKTYVASVGVGTWLKAYTYLHGKATGDTYTDWSVVGADVAGSGDKNFLYIRPKHAFDEVRLEFGGVLQVTPEPQKFYGFFLQHDIDGDGLPDCQDVESCPDPVPVQPTCEGQLVYVEIKDSILNDSARIGHTYTLRCNEPGIGADSLIEHVRPDINNYIIHTHRAVTPGESHRLWAIDEMNGDKVAEAVYSVRPIQTEWKRNAATTDWNAWNNWTQGAPYCCTSVIIPSDAERYPTLINSTESQHAPEYYCCNDVQLEPRAAINGTQLLAYHRAFVDVDIPANRYRYFSPSLKATYSGDMFYSQAANAGSYFMQLNEQTYPEDRLTTPVYQRMWNTTIASGDVSLNPDAYGTKTDPVQLKANETEWTHYVNTVSNQFAKGQVTNLWVDHGEMSDHTAFRFRFPKTHTTYHYYNDADATVLGQETISRTVDQTDDVNRDLTSYRFIYEKAHDSDQGTLYKYQYFNRDTTDTVAEPRVRYDNHLDVSIDLATSSPTPTKTFLLGNPFVGRIQLSKFLDVNRDVVAAVSFPSGDTPGDRLTADGLATSERTYLEPMEAMFVEAKEDASALSVVLTYDMMMPDDDTQTAPAPSAAPAMRITAHVDSLATSMLLVDGREAETPALLDGEVQPKLALFAMSRHDESLTACQILTAAEETPLCIIAPDTAHVRLSLHAQGLFPRDSYYLADRLTNDVWPLEDDIVLPTTGTTVGRYVIRRGDVYTPTPVETHKASDHGLVLQITHRTARATGATHIAVYTTDGSLLSQGRQTATLQRGVNILRVTTEDGHTQSYRIVAK